MTDTFVSREGWHLDRRIRMPVSMSMRRIIELMEAHPERVFADEDLAAEVPCDRSTAARTLAQLHAAGILRVVHWRQTGACPQACYWFAMGQPDAPRPRAMTHAEKKARRTAYWRERVGDRAWRVLSSRNFGGADRVVIDGRVVYERGALPGRRKGA